MHNYIDVTPGKTVHDLTRADTFDYSPKNKIDRCLSILFEFSATPG